MQHYAAFYLCPHHLLNYLFRSLPYTKDSVFCSVMSFLFSVLSGIKQVNVELEPGFQSKKRNNGMHPSTGIQVEGKMI